ncbi:MAG: hypothetical protein WAL63_11515 [Solirubrobacteraceae bacterium]
MTLALNIVLMAVVFSAVVGALAWTILSSRPGRHVRPGRPAARQPAYRQRAHANWHGSNPLRRSPE